ncbi:scavenger receptor cysteine-rich domain-containing group B protein [Boleophthalmus pectinirostris]|uniref:scavenger receptor cysteine-rich domain-containing group B protein n=1 Tax=Boleophthalmus pectinirostris TaxID=150288 RepID=UPI002431E2C1|nr:scavenger receptor cysteine-rich domain-containing group B protein [Boleophthalmus pectinirostris]
MPTKLHRHKRRPPIVIRWMVRVQVMMTDAQCWVSGVWLLLTLLCSLHCVVICSVLPYDHNSKGNLEIHKRDVFGGGPGFPEGPWPPYDLENLPFQIQNPIRLVNGMKACEGRLEIFHEGEWGTVCDDDWDMVDASVVCRQLQCGQPQATRTTAYFGPGTGPILMDNVECDGFEAELGQCKSAGWGVHNCSHYEDVGVQCKEILSGGKDFGEFTTPWPTVGLGPSSGDIRLVNGTHECEGRVEIFYNGVWGTVCDDDWSMNNSRVVCWQLNCGEALSYHGRAYFQRGTGEIFLDNVNCYGYEDKLEKCPHLGWGTHNCGHHEDAGVTCALPTTTQQSKWNGTTAATTTTMNVPTTTSAATTTTTTTTNAPTTTTAATTTTTNVPTTTTAATTTTTNVPTTTSAATTTTTTTTNAPTTTTAATTTTTIVPTTTRATPAIPATSATTGTSTTTGKPGGNRDFTAFTVTPAPATKTTTSPTTTTKAPTIIQLPAPIRLVNGNHRCEGRVEIWYSGTWGTVCDDNWHIANAVVVCAQLKCGSAKAALDKAAFGAGVGPILLDNVDCRGNEAGLSFCSSSRWGEHNCNHNEDAAVICDSIEITQQSGELARNLPGLAAPAPKPMTTAPPTTAPSGTSVSYVENGFKAINRGTLRLVGGHHPCEGRVEVYLQYEWGTVCDDAWDLPDAMVVCRELGCGQAVEAVPEARFGAGTGTIQMDNLKCLGSESSLMKCSYIPWNVHNCDHSEDAGVVCQTL